MGMRIDGGEQTPQNNLREVEQNKTEIQRLRLLDQLQKVQTRMKELEGKDNNDVAIRGFHFEYTAKNTPDTEAMYKALEAQQKAILNELEEVEHQLDAQKTMLETEQTLEKEIKQEKQKAQEELKEAMKKEIKDLVPKFGY